MEYNEVKQLLEKYFLSDTSLEEEQALRNYFRQEDIPEDMMRYQLFFNVGKQISELHAKDDFDDELWTRIGEQKSGKIRSVNRLRNLVRAACVIILLALSIGWLYHHFNNIRDRLLTGTHNVASGEDTYQNPEQAFRQMETVLEQISYKFNKASDLAAEKAAMLQTFDAKSHLIDSNLK